MEGKVFSIIIQWLVLLTSIPMALVLIPSVKISSSLLSMIDNWVPTSAGEMHSSYDRSGQPRACNSA